MEEDRDKKSRGKHIGFWLIEESPEHKYLLEAIAWWRSKKEDLSEKLRLGLTLVAYIDTGDTEGFLNKIPGAFYRNLQTHFSHTTSIPNSIPYLMPNNSLLDTAGGLEAIETDKDDLVSKADSGLDDLF